MENAVIISQTVDEAVRRIELIRKENELKIGNFYQEMSNSLKEGIDYDYLNKIDENISKLNYGNVLQAALELEKSGNLIDAARLYWENIYVNGTDTPANFNRLLVVLKKLKLYCDALKAAEIYIHFVDEPYKSKIQEMIHSIEKKLNKNK